MNDNFVQELEKRLAITRELSPSKKKVANQNADREDLWTILRKIESLSNEKSVIVLPRKR